MGKNAPSRFKVERADIFLVVEVVVTSVSALFSHFFIHEPVMTWTIVVIGVLITISTYTIKVHVNEANKQQTEESKEYWKAIKPWVEVQRHQDTEIKRVGVDIVEKAKQSLERLWYESTWSVHTSFDLDILIRDYVKQSEHSIQATALSARKWKEEQSFRELFDENLNCVSRGVVIERIFILFDDEMKDPEVRKIIEEHKAGGIKVQCVRSNKLPPERIKDFLIFDGKKVIWENLTPDTKTFTDGTVSKNSQTVQEWTKVFKGISNQANPNIGEFFA